jgi:hypothetical protein
MKLKSQVKKGGTTLNAMTGGVKTSMNDEINDVVIPTKRKTKEN